MATFANSRRSQSQFCPNKLQTPLRTEIKPLLCTTSSRAALSLQLKLSPFCSNPSYNLCHYICLFAICHYRTEISFKIFVNALQEVSQCYWTVLQIPLFLTVQAQLCQPLPHMHSLSSFARTQNGPSSTFLSTPWSAVPLKLNGVFQTAFQTLNTGDKNSHWGTASRAAQCLVYLICNDGTFKALAQFNITHGVNLQQVLYLDWSSTNVIQ